MVSILIALSLLFPTDSLPDACTCELPPRFQPKEVNIDTLRYLNEQESFREGLFLTFSYLKKDSTNRELMGWLNNFSHKMAEQASGNEKKRRQKYKDNPHVKYNVVQDTVGYIVFRARTKYGPSIWNEQIRKSVGKYALCSDRCLTSLYPNDREIFTRYIHTLIRMNEFEKVPETVKGKNFGSASTNQSRLVGEFFMDFNRFYLPYSAYMHGLEYSKMILENYNVSKRVQDRWYHAYHYAIRSDNRIPARWKPKVHDKVDEFIPEVEDL